MGKPANRSRDASQSPAGGDIDVQRDIGTLKELLVDALEFAHAARERQLAAQDAAGKLATRYGVTLQQLAEEIGISVDSVESLLEKTAISLPARLNMDERSVDTLLQQVAKRRLWHEETPGSYDERLRLDSVILRTLLTRAPVGFAVLDPDLRYVLVNEALAEINGLPAEEHIGRSIWDVVPNIAQEATDAFQRVMGSGEPILNIRLTGSVAAAPGDTRTWYESVYRIADSRGVLGLAVIVVEMDQAPGV